MGLYFPQVSVCCVALGMRLLDVVLRELVKVNLAIDVSVNPKPYTKESLVKWHPKTPNVAKVECSGAGPIFPCLQAVFHCVAAIIPKTKG